MCSLRRIVAETKVILINGLEESQPNYSLRRHHAELVELLEDPKQVIMITMEATVVSLIQNFVKHDRQQCSVHDENQWRSLTARRHIFRCGEAGE
jgi:hypothetical protein